MTNHPRRLGRRKHRRQAERRVLARTSVRWRPTHVNGVDLTRFVQQVQFEESLGMRVMNPRELIFYPAE